MKTACKLIEHPKIAIDLAIVIGNTVAKISLKHHESDFLPYVKNWILKCESDFARLCLITGCLNHGLITKTLLEFSFGLVLKSCQLQSNHAYQSFQCLKLWSMKAKSFQEMSVYFKEDKVLIQELLDLINSNWENPLRGVSDLLVDTMTNVLAILKDPSLDKQLLEKTLSNLNWKMKAKYPPLMVLLPRVGVENVLNEYPDFGEGLTQSLSSNHLASAGASCYRTIIKTKAIFSSWKTHLMKPFLECLCHDPRSLVRNNAKNHWLNPTLTFLPKEAAESMLELLDESDECSVVRFLIIKGQRLNGQVEQLDESYLHLVGQGLNHSNPDVCLAAFSVIAHVKKKGSVPSSQELQLCIDFLVNHLTVDDPSFRQSLISDFTQLMIRCRDTSVSLFKKKDER